MKIILIILTILIVAPTKASSLTYMKFTSNDVILLDGSRGGRADSEGFIGENNDFPNCSKFGRYSKGLRQGLKVFYDVSGKINYFENGIFDCKKSIKGDVGLAIFEGLSEKPNLINVLFKNDKFNQYIYVKSNNQWSYIVMNIDYFSHIDPNSNYKERLATPEEINHAERLYKFYKEIDLSSPNAKKYNVINTSINLNESKKNQDPAPAKKQSETGVAAELERLQKLFNSGAITKDEYQKAKNKVLK